MNQQEIERRVREIYQQAYTETAGSHHMLRIEFAVAPKLRALDAQIELEALETQIGLIPRKPPF